MIDVGNFIKGNATAVNTVSSAFSFANTVIRKAGFNGFSLGGSGYRPSQWGKANTSNMVMIKSNVGGFFADAIFSCNVDRALSITTHPVQSGANISDHAILQPAVITMELGISDAMASYSSGGYTIKSLEDTVQQAINIDSVRAGLESAVKNAFAKRTTGGEAKSTKAIKLLEQMQAARSPMTVVTPRGESISNCLIENLSWEESADSLYSIRVQLSLKQIFVAKVSDTKASARNWVSGAKANKGEAESVEAPASFAAEVNGDPIYAKKEGY